MTSILLSLLIIFSLVAPLDFAQAQDLSQLIARPLVPYPESPNTWMNVGFGDTNGDGANELVAINSALHLVRILKVSSDYSLSLVQEIPLTIDPNYTSPWGYVSIKVVDMNNDSKNEIVFWQRTNNGKGRLFVLTRKSDGTYVENVYRTPETDAVYGMDVGDFNGDGLLDVLTANFGHTSPATVFVLYNAADESRFQTYTAHSAPTSRIAHVYATDFNMDGKMDAIATTHPFGAKGVVLFENIGSQLGPGTVLAGPEVTETVGVTDINGDGLVDIVATDSKPWSHVNTIQIFLRQGATFAPPVTVVAGPSVKSPRFWDVNGDGRMDIVLNCTYDRTVNFLFQQSAEPLSFSAPVAYADPVVTSIDHGYTTMLDNFDVGDVTNDGSPNYFFAMNAGFIIGKADSAPPLISITSLAPSPVPVGTSLVLEASANDTATGNSAIKTIEYRVGNSTFTAMYSIDGGFDTPIEQASVVISPFDTADVVEICVRATDIASNQSQPVCEYLPVFDPNGGFVTGGGAITSPAGADLDDPTATGPARFGFVSKYLKGRSTPDGNVQFRFQAGNIKFTSSSMEWLVVTGEPRAVFRGIGVVEGSGTCRFEVDAWDGSLPDSGADGFGFRLFGCENGKDRYSLPAQPLTQGSIIIHR